MNKVFIKVYLIIEIFKLMESKTINVWLKALATELRNFLVSVYD